MNVDGWLGLMRRDGCCLRWLLEKGLMMETFEQHDLRAQVQESRDRILALVAEIDDILLQQNPRIQANYMVKIGVWENELLSTQLAARRAKRKCELAQAAANRGEAVSAESLSAIDALLDDEFAEWETSLNARLSDYAAAVERRVNGREMSEEESAEFKRLYRAISKRLHPDLCDCDDEEAARLFMLAQSAYEAGDLEALRSLDVATRKYDRADDIDALTDDELAAELALSDARVVLLEGQLEAIKDSEPYCLAEKLEDVSWVCARVQDLKNQIAQADEVRAEYLARVRKLEGAQ